MMLLSNDTHKLMPQQLIGAASVFQSPLRLSKISRYSLWELLRVDVTIVVVIKFLERFIEAPGQDSRIKINQTPNQTLHRSTSSPLQKACWGYPGYWSIRQMSPQIDNMWYIYETYRKGQICIILKYWQIVVICICLFFILANISNIDKHVKYWQIF